MKNAKDFSAESLEAAPEAAPGGAQEGRTAPGEALATMTTIITRTITLVLVKLLTTDDKDDE